MAVLILTVYYSARLHLSSNLVHDVQTRQSFYGSCNL